MLQLLGVYVIVSYGGKFNTMDNAIYALNGMDQLARAFIT